LWIVLGPDAGKVDATVTKAWGLAGEGCETITRLDKPEVRDDGEIEMWNQERGDLVLCQIRMAD